MNISQAKDYIKHSIQIYLKKDEFGDYRIPVVRQRPLFLLGAPGIGKTAIMEQIAQEMGVALVSYSMTHHTRQSALGLPFIKQKEYGGKTYDVSEYTMSEIIASIYDTMEESGVTEGILFLDEINCVSETLAPSMLQFLQYKVFGKHKVPEGWVIVTAGNPPEYNKSVREFDVVTMDRLKVLEVEADYATWKIYAKEKGIHTAIMNFLELKKEYFYHMETTVKGRSYVTARGWEDLSQVMQMYEEDGILADEDLFAQYLQNEKIVKAFGAYYDLYNKYKKDYQVERLLGGAIEERVIEKARAASFDERLSLLGMLLDTVQFEMKEVVEMSAFLSEMMPALKAVKTADSVYEMLDIQANARDTIMKNLQKANALSSGDRKKHKRIYAFLTETKKEILANELDDGEVAFSYIKEKFDAKVSEMKELVAKTTQRIHYLFAFVHAAFEEGNEMLVLVTELTVNRYSSTFISTFGCEDYQKYNEILMVSKRQEDLRGQIAELLL
ncbi:MAG: AAA family ATPase [Eubacteriales bacterium]|nr:AAA family ATPase [Eubacteriales bacterium]